jgi:hypothetical protein
LNEYRILEEHVLLTFNVESIKGYLRKILNIKENIVLFSLFSNIEYYYRDGSKIFNPFDTNHLGIQKRSNDDRFYQFYENAVSRTIFCIKRQHLDNSDSLGSEGVFFDKWKSFTDKIFKNISKYDYELTIINRDVIDIPCELPFQFVRKILNDPIYKCYYVNRTDTSIIFSGYSQTYNLDPELEKKRGEHFKIFKDDNLISEYYMGELKIYNPKVWDEMPLSYKEEFYIKNKTFSYTDDVYFNTQLKFKLDIDLSFDFILMKIQRAENIYSDISSKITIMTATDHIKVTTRGVKYEGMSSYLCYLILGYSNIHNKFMPPREPKIKNRRYKTKTCQDSEKFKKRPILAGEIDESKYEKIHPTFYKGKTIKKEYYDENNNLVYENYKYSDIFINNGLAIKCPRDNCYLGFIDTRYKWTRDCEPCCFVNPVYDKASFRGCVFGLETENDIIDPFIRFNQREKLQVLYNVSELAILPDRYNNLINNKSDIKFYKSRLISAKHYIAYKKSDYLDSVKNLSDLEALIEFNKNRGRYSIVIIKDEVKTPIISDRLDLYDIFFVIQNKTHILVSIDKDSGSDKINVSPVDIRVIEFFLNIFKRKFNDPIIKYEDEKSGMKFEFNYNNLYVNDKLYHYNHTSSFIELKIPTNTFNLSYKMEDIENINKDEYLFTRDLNIVNSSKS